MELAFLLFYILNIGKGNHQHPRRLALERKGNAECFNHTYSYQPNEAQHQHQTSIMFTEHRVSSEAYSTASTLDITLTSDLSSLRKCQLCHDKNGRQ